MRNNPIFFISILSLILLLIDLYAYRGIKKLISRKSNLFRRIVFYLFWAVPLLIISGLMFFVLNRNEIRQENYLYYFHLLSGSFFLFYLPKLLFIVFNFADDLVLLFRKIFLNKKSTDEKNDGIISRRQFLTRAGIIAAGIPFLSIAYGIKWGRFNYTIRNQKIFSSNLPRSFNGFKIVQISDFHLGSFLGNENEIEEAVKIINDQNADVILFTGDLVNNVAKEVDGFIHSLKKLKARFGKYSVLGNHDYGDYVPWDSEEDKKQNLQRLISLQKELGFDLLMNESRKLRINNDEISLLGVENWGLRPFPQYGDLNKALEKVEENSFKILMSHDPTHWDEQVLEKTNIDLTLSGHTHGAQFGIEIPGWRWSPVKLRYKRWGGIYREKSQYLYVNTGIGFIGFPGRVGMPPEITLIELSNEVEA